MQKFWHKDVSVTNTSEAVYQPVNVVGVYNPPGTNQDVVTVSSGNVFVAEIPEGFVYDADGNLTQDGRWVYSWDGENRLIAVETATNVENLVPKMKLDFTYDYQSRRVGKVVSVCSNSAWVAVRTNLFIYDGWNLIAEIQNSRSSSVLSTNFYVWGLDLSGSLQGAGGIGGLVSAVLDGPSSNSMVFYAYDANGNVADVINGDTGAIAAHYEYSPFGETVVQAGDAQVLALNPYAFSTKYLDRETSLYYYGHRFYNPLLGRWVSRGPTGGNTGGVRSSWSC
jgi:RHS repeat-associated protein